MAKISQEEIESQIQYTLTLIPPDDIYAPDYVRAMVRAQVPLDEEEVMTPAAREVVGLLSGAYLSALNGYLRRGEAFDLKELRHHLDEILDEMEEILVLHTPAVLDGQTLHRTPGPAEEN